MKKNRKLLISIFGIPFIGCLIYVVNLQMSRRTEIPLGKLLLTNADFPTRWNTGLEMIEVDEWKIQETEFVLPADNSFYSSFNLGRQWVNEIPSQLLVQNMYYYSSPFTAARQFILSRPEIAYGDDWPNFTLSHLKENRYPDKESYESSFADQEHIVCAMGSPNSCQLWYYWARYGQYILKIRFFAPNQGMSVNVFMEIVGQVDSHVGIQLEN